MAIHEHKKKLFTHAKTIYALDWHNKTSNSFKSMKIHTLDANYCQTGNTISILTEKKSSINI